MRIPPIAALLLIAGADPAAAEMAMFSQRNFEGARYALQAESSSLSFSPRSIRVLPDQPWQLCPRPFFGGACVVVSAANPKFNLPRAFSGMVRSARPAPASGPAPQAADAADKPTGAATGAATDKAAPKS
jgi:hypothetical protein